MLPGSRRLVLKLRELDRRVAFLPNNPTRGPGMYAEKLTKLGLETSAGEIVNPVVTLARWLLQSHTRTLPSSPSPRSRQKTPCAGPG